MALSTLPTFASPSTAADDGAALFHLVYVSSAVTPFSHDQLLAILERSRLNNSRVGVTGLLLYREGNIMQALEGTEAAVRAVHSRIVGDPRHRGCITLIQAPTPERAFAGWSMGFRELDSEQVHATPGYSDFMNHRDRSQNLPADPNRAWQLLMTFRRGMR